MAYPAHALIALPSRPRVNKALLYYYFKSKQGLYAAAIEGVSATVIENAMAEFDPSILPAKDFCDLHSTISIGS